MNSLIWSSRSGMKAQMEKMDTISNNLANLNNYGYKSINNGFKDLVYDNLNQTNNPISSDEANILAGTGVQTTTALRNNTQGNLSLTDVPTDLAIDGDGYFRKISSDGESLYSRTGVFHITGNGQIADDNGNLLEIVNGENANFTNNNFFVDSAGNITSQNKNSGEYINRGKINLYDFIGDYSMTSVGTSDFSATGDIYTVNDSFLNQGSLELSNVDITNELTEMINATRNIQYSQKALEASNEMLKIANNLKG